MSDADFATLRATLDTEVASVVDKVRAVVRAAVPEAVEEVDVQGRMVGYTFQPGTCKGQPGTYKGQPGTYKGLVAAIVAHRAYVNLMFARRRTARPPGG